MTRSRGRLLNSESSEQPNSTSFSVVRAEKRESEGARKKRAKARTMRTVVAVLATTRMRCTAIRMPIQPCAQRRQKMNAWSARPAAPKASGKKARPQLPGETVRKKKKEGQWKRGWKRDDVELRRTNDHVERAEMIAATDTGTNKSVGTDAQAGMACGRKTKKNGNHSTPTTQRNEGNDGTMWQRCGGRMSVPSRAAQP